MILTHFFKELILNDDEKELAGIKFSAQNLDRIALVSLLAIPVSLIHIFVFISNLHKGTVLEFQWRSNIILAHSLVCIVLLATFLAIYFTKRKHHTSPALSKFITHFAYCFVLFIGTLIACFDQSVTNAVSPYFLVCLFIPIIIIMPPVQALFYFVMSYLLFSFLLPVYQHNTNILLSIYVNGLSAMAFGSILSIILWKLNLTRYRQDFIIQQQKNRLEDQNSKLLQFSEELKQINESKDRFFSILAHDLRSPMNGFLGLTGIVADELDSLSEKQIKDMAVSMKNSATNICNLLDNLLEWSRVQRGYITTNFEKLNLAAVVENCVQLFRDQARRKGVFIVSNIRNDVYLMADRHLLEIIIRNLVSNALKYSVAEGVILLAAVTTDDASVKLSIKDTGIGMNPQIAESLFKIAESSNRKGTLGEPSTGLGLILCKEYIDKHDGVIQVETEEGKGSTFTVILPQTAKNP